MPQLCSVTESRENDRADSFANHTVKATNPRGFGRSDADGISRQHDTTVLFKLSGFVMTNRILFPIKVLCHK